MTPNEIAAIEGRPLLLFDGVCALCNGLVRFLLKRDPQKNLRFAPLQSSLGREILARFELHTVPDGVILITNTLTPTERLCSRSDAASEALQLIRDPWPQLGRALSHLPRALREPGYTLVARLRYRIFGRYDTCPLPPPESRSQILGLYE